MFENNGAPAVRSMGGAPVIVIQTDCVAFNRRASSATPTEPSINESGNEYSPAAGLQQQKVRSAGSGLEGIQATIWNKYVPMQRSIASSGCP
ncbi:hypothetical protein [Bradyrhizobium tropiciagri]|uniref:hypothetical protein n=1 Tax=Bradyrhizobium tropiciagri TaxID=312253 RepID=UPI00138EFEBA|nr:hypothetical protein [Bradyrhizobium tropiciagri]